MTARRAQSIATRKGDDGTTALLYGQRVSKDHPQIEAVGALDELNAALGLARARRPAGPAVMELERIQRDLVAIMGEVSCAETDSARYAASSFPKLDGWATPGANPAGAALDFARTVARRAERRLVGLAAHGRQLRPLLLHYVNRVSDLLWLLARETETL
jgi:cob(I)alamin adenosyltransferase